jgi:hypothetical protein
LSSQPSGGVSACLLRALRVLRLHEEVDVVLGLRAAARPHREPAAERERNLGVAQRAGGLLQRVEDHLEVEVDGHAGWPYPRVCKPEPAGRTER